MPGWLFMVAVNAALSQANRWSCSCLEKSDRHILDDKIDTLMLGHETAIISCVTSVDAARLQTTVRPSTCPVLMLITSSIGERPAEIILPGGQPIQTVSSICWRLSELVCGGNGSSTSGPALAFLHNASLRMGQSQ